MRYTNESTLDLFTGFASFSDEFLILIRQLIRMGFRYRELNVPAAQSGMTRVLKFVFAARMNRIELQHSADRE